MIYTAIFYLGNDKSETLNIVGNGTTAIIDNLYRLLPLLRLTTDEGQIRHNRTKIMVIVHQLEDRLNWKRIVKDYAKKWEAILNYVNSRDDTPATA